MPCPPRAEGRVDAIKTDVTLPQESDAGCFLYDTNVIANELGLPYRSPIPHPTNLELAQIREYLDRLNTYDV